MYGTLKVVLRFIAKAFKKVQDSMDSSKALRQPNYSQITRMLLICMWRKLISNCLLHLGYCRTRKIRHILQPL